MRTTRPARMFAVRFEMYSAWLGGHWHGIRIGCPLVPFTAPSQFPVPSGLIPDCHPSGGASAAICASVGNNVVLPDDGAVVLFTVDEGEGDENVGADVIGHEARLVVWLALVLGVETAEVEGDAVGVGVGDSVFDVSASIAFCCAEKVVDEMGHPTPGPSKFCKVTAAAFRRASCEAVLLSVGKVSLTVGFVVTKPAATFSLRAVRKNVEFGGH